MLFDNIFDIRHKIKKPALNRFFFRVLFSLFFSVAAIRIKSRLLNIIAFSSCETRELTLCAVDSYWDLLRK